MGWILYFLQKIAIFLQDLALFQNLCDLSLIQRELSYFYIKTIIDWLPFAISEKFNLDISDKAADLVQAKQAHKCKSCTVSNSTFHKNQH